jgi:DNA-binding transcriptional regulator LsrR (DeoR family)
MDNALKKMIANKRLATFRVKSWIGTYTKQEIAVKLGISRPTLDKRMLKDNWNYKELELITKNLPF